MKKILTNTEYRFLLHVPVGVLAVLLTMKWPVVGGIFSILFGLYEVMNDWRKKDSSYKDVIGFLAGYGITGVIFLIGEL